MEEINLGQTEIAVVTCFTAQLAHSSGSGDLERKFDLEISPLCNQQSDSVPAIQIGFISYIVEPLFEEWMRFTGDSELTESMLGHLRKNKTRWRQLRQEPQPGSPLQEEAEGAEDSGTP